MRRRILFLAAGVLLRPILNEQLHACNRSRARPERVRGTVEALDAPEFSLRDSETGRVYTIILTDETVLLSGTREVARTALRPGGTVTIEGRRQTSREWEARRIWLSSGPGRERDDSPPAGGHRH